MEKNYKIPLINKNIDIKTINKLLIINKALENDWKVEKMGNQYIFTKKHDNKKEVYEEDYLDEFVYKNMIII